MSKGIAKQLMYDARRGIISKDALLSVCLEHLERISEESLYKMALDEGFIKVDRADTDETFEPEFKELDATQRIIERVLSRHGE